MTLLLLVLITVVSMQLHAEEVQYQIRFNRALTESQTDLCFDRDRAPSMLITGSRAAVTMLKDLQVTGGSVRRKANRLYLTPDSDRICLRLVQRFDARNSNHNWRKQRNGAMRFNGDLMIPIGSWLWRPAKLKPNQRLRLMFDLPAGMAISAPWPQLASNQYHVDYQMPYNWSGRLAVGRFSPKPVEVGGKTLNVALVGGLESRENLLNWIVQAAEAVANVSGYFPTDQTQVLVLPVGPDKEAVPWAEIQRQGRPSVHFFVDQHRPIYEFTSDWTAVHEFSHLLHPYILRTDAWLYEGIASYYQNIARARSGMLSEKQAWQKLYEGFQRGSKRLGGSVLRDSNRIMQIYWGGAALILMADVELRQRSKGRQSIERVLHQFRQCCGEDMGPWSAKAMFLRLDQLSGLDTLTRLYRQQVSQRSFPEVYGMLNKLGVKVRNGQVYLDDNAPLAEIRREIVWGRETSVGVIR